jgi:hypothetical protein
MVVASDRGSGLSTLHTMPMALAPCPLWPVADRYNDKTDA